MNFLREIAGELSNLELTVKPHPACPINPADYTEINFEISDQPLSDLLNLFDVAYTSCLTSAAVDAYCAGLQVISVLDPTALNLSPLRGITGVKFVSSARDLHNALLEISSQSHEDAKRINYFYVDPSLPRWRALISGNLSHEEV